MWSARSRLLRAFSTGKFPLPPSQSPLGKLFALITLGGMTFLGVSFLDKEETNEIQIILDNLADRDRENSKLILLSRPVTTLKKNIQSDDSKKNEELKEVIENMKQNEEKKIENLEIKKAAEELQSKTEKNLDEKKEDSQVGSGVEVGLYKEHSNE